MERLLKYFSGHPILSKLIIRDSKSYSTVKKNISKRVWIKTFVLLIDIGITYLSAYTVVCMQRLVDTVTIGGADGMSHFKSALIYIIAVLAIYMGSQFLQSFINFFAAKGNMVEVIKFVFTSYYKQDFLFAKRNDSGEVASKFMNEVQDIGSWIFSGVISFIQSIAEFAIKFGMLYMYSPKLAIFCVVGITFCFAVTRKLNYIIAQISKKMYAVSSDLVQFFMMANRSFVEVKQLQKEDLYINKLIDIINNKMYKYRFESMCWSAIYSTIFTSIGYVFPVVVLFAGLYMTLQGEFTVGKTAAVYALVSSTQAPLKELANWFSSRKSMMIVSERLDCFVENLDKKDGVETFDKFESLEFFSEKFSYDDKVSILQNIRFQINRGDIFCIKGRTGAGKTTITSLLIRFLPMQSGYIKINGKNVEEYSSSSFYKNVNMLNQNIFIFQNTLKNNITFEEEYPEEFLQEVIKTAQLEDFVKEYGLDHVLNEDANNISGGQKQRIALARILIRKPQILVLDEPTAALDEKTSTALVEALKIFKDKYGMTLIVITHSSVFDNVADQVLDLDNNRVGEC